MIYLVSPQQRVLSDHIRNITADQAFDKLSRATYLQVDCETTGLSFLDDQLLLIQIGTSEVQVVYDVRNGIDPTVKTLLEDSSKLKMLHNAVFDYKFLKKAGIVLNHIWDTMIIEKLLHNGEVTPHGFYKLNNVVERYTQTELSKEMQSSFINHTGADFTNSQLQYAASDVMYLEQVRDGQVAHLKQSKLMQCAKLENEACLGFGDIEYNGMLVDKDLWSALGKAEGLKAEMLEASLNGIILQDPLFAEFAPETYQTTLFGTDEQDLADSVTINWSSPTQVLPILQAIVPDLENCDTKNLALAHRQDHELIDFYISYRESSKLSTAFGQEWLDKYVCSDGKVHTRFQQILRTGRVSSSGPNMQQIPANNAYRNCFICPEGWSYISSDFSSQELCIIAHGSQDPVWLKSLEEGEDLHSVCADLVYGDVWHAAAGPECEYLRSKSKCSCPEHKKLRTAVKSINFGLAYGMGPNKLASQLQISIDEASELIKTYFKVFPSIKEYLDGNASFGKKHGYIRTMEPYRRIRYFPDWRGRATDKALMGKIDRMSRNTPIQGTAGDMTKEAMVRCRREFQNKSDIQMVMVVHDQLDFIVKTPTLEYYSKRITKHMEAAGKSIITNGLLKADTTTSKSWEK
tara:strand:- start:4562 stop:6457 length:1896 start_codon:yes stop_codon:yes gene_type:complete